MSDWCRSCYTQHDDTIPCPGGLNIDSPEERVWRATVETPRGPEAYGILLGQSGDSWRARVFTFPDTLWKVPGENATMKFAGETPQDACHRAVDFVRWFCDQHWYTIRSEEALHASAWSTDSHLPAREERRPPRKACFLPVRFGVGRLSDLGTTTDISEKGMFIMTGMLPPDRRQVCIECRLASRAIELKGIIRWRREQIQRGRSIGVGIELVDPPEDYMDYVRNL